VKPDLKEKIRKIKLLVLDVDGVMTDGSIVYDDSGLESKAFDVKDGHGIKLLERGGVKTALLTGRTSNVVEHRAKDLGIELVYQGCKDKGKAFEELLSRTSLDAGEVAFVGDDLVDLPVLKRAGLSVTVPDAVEEVKGRVDYVTQRPGGRGAVREVVEVILKAQGKWEGLIEGYFR
jgi:3-deoxy-D-manno-octulosonate 8-phosphate phosphatase (KDO 8-P phosphatase)